MLSASKSVSPFWLTMRSGDELGGHVRKGEESTIVVFWKVDTTKQSTGDLDNEETDGEGAPDDSCSAYYRVFNLEQCETAAGGHSTRFRQIETHEHDPIEAAERIIAAMLNSARDSARRLKGVLQPDCRSNHFATARAFRER